MSLIYDVTVGLRSERDRDSKLRVFKIFSSKPKMFFSIAKEEEEAASESVNALFTNTFENTTCVSG